MLNGFEASRRQMRLVCAILLCMVTLMPEVVRGENLLEGFGRFGRFHDDGLLTLNIFPDRAEATGLTLRFASAGVTPTVQSINSTAKVLALPGGGEGDATHVRYTLLYPGFTATFNATARLRLGRAVTVEEITASTSPLRRGLLVRSASGNMVPVGLAFGDGVAPQWVLQGGNQELVISSATALGEIRFFTPMGTRSLSSSPSAADLATMRQRSEEWIGRGAPVISSRRADVDFDAGTVTITETFSVPGGGAPIAPVPPVLAFALQNGYPATVQGTVQRSGFATRYGEFGWVNGSTLTYTLPIPPQEERGLLRPYGREAEVALLNDMADRMGASWAKNAVDLAYAGMTPAQMTWPHLTPAKRQALTNAWNTYLPLAFRLPPYPDGDTRQTWVEETEPLSGLKYIYTYFITGGPGGSYKLDLEWGNLLPVYGLMKYAQFTGDWDFARTHWATTKLMTKYTDYADDWAWMTNTNGDMGWSTGTGDPMTAAFAGHMAALRLARGLGDDAAARHFAYRAARVAVPTVSRFWYTPWARQQGFIGANQIVQGFWERSTFTATTMSQTATDPWGPTNPLSGNGCQHEVFMAFMAYIPEALRTYEDEMLVGYPNLWNPEYQYPISTTYGGNSVYVTFPHIYARTWLGEPTDDLWAILNRAQSNRRTSGWIAPVVIAELLARDTPMILTEWQPLRWREGAMQDSSLAVLSFEARQSTNWTLRARLQNGAKIRALRVAGEPAEYTLDGNELSLTQQVNGVFQVEVEFEGALGDCPSSAVVDNETPSLFTSSGSWTASANPPLVGSSSVFAYGGPLRTATWRPNLRCAGEYEVYATWVAAPNRSAAASYSIVHRGGSTAVAVNQQENGNRWNLLGRFSFDAGSEGAVSLSNEGVAADAIVSADAVRFVYMGPLNGPVVLY